MSDLKSRLEAMIRTSGPISVAAYMDLCLHDRRQGYYATRPGLGEDFITAPEISQIFGELIGLWLAHEWQALGAPANFTLVELGPGRGTLMTDALRATNTVPGFGDALRLHFLEASPVLRTRLTDVFAARQPVFLDRFESIPTGIPILIIANEWLDCLPVQQYLRVGEAWHERVVGLGESGSLSFGLNAQALPPEIAPDIATDSLELQPGLKTLSEHLGSLFADTPGRALFVDYGSATDAPGDTLRAYRNGAQIDPLAAPGESDLTCDVDFARLARLVRQQGLAVGGPVSQSRFLLQLGAEARLNQLAQRHPERAEDLYSGIRKLTDPAQMGARFQAVCVSSPGLPDPAAF